MIRLTEAEEQRLKAIFDREAAIGTVGDKSDFMFLLRLVARYHGETPTEIYIETRRGEHARTEYAVPGEVMLDFDSAGRLLGVEILREAAASVALDGETQTVPTSGAVLLPADIADHLPREKSKKSDHVRRTE